MFVGKTKEFNADSLQSIQSIYGVGIFARYFICLTPFGNFTLVAILPPACFS